MPNFDLHQEITNRIVSAIETAGEFHLPWSNSTSRPVNVASKNPYNGVNVISLWVTALSAEYPSNTWGTYSQWQEKGCQVRRGEKSSLVVFYKTYKVEEEETERWIAQASFVFNAAQVNGF